MAEPAAALGSDGVPTPLLRDSALERIELELLLEGIYRQYGYDFREYALGSLRRRLWRRAHAEGARTLSALQELVLHDPACMNRLLADLSINVTALFRDPTFFAAFREKAVPLLRTYPFIRVWTAGCASGEEAYSLAMLLLEEGLYERTRIYATDTNEAVLARARAGRFAADRLPEYGRNHARAGGTRPLTDYVRIDDGSAVFLPEVAEHIVFAEHDLVTDRSFNEFHVIFCRNVMIYFSRTLQDDVHRLFYDSLTRFGVLALGRRETLRFTPFEAAYETLDVSEKLYRKVA
jgi:chemotaxis protein methyltransferase CheR